MCVEKIDAHSRRAVSASNSFQPRFPYSRLVMRHMQAPCDAGSGRHIRLASGWSSAGWFRNVVTGVEHTAKVGADAAGRHLKVMPCKVGRVVAVEWRQRGDGKRNQQCFPKCPKPVAA